MSKKEKNTNQISLFNVITEFKQGREKEEKYIRPSWDEYFMAMMQAISLRSTCDRGRSGCVIVKDNQVLATGYVGSAKGDYHCDDVGHQMQKRLNQDDTISMHCIRTVHAEQNAICQAAKRGVSIDGGTLYCRMTPCLVCAKLIVNCGIKRVVAERKYHAGEESIKLFEKVGVSIEHLHDELEKYGELK